MGLGTKGLERRARAEGLIAPHDHFVAVEVGDVASWVSAGNIASFQSTNMALAFTTQRLVVLGADMVAAVDLLMIWTVKASEPLRQLDVSYLHDTDDYRTSFSWRATRRDSVVAFGDRLKGAAERRRGDFPIEVQQAVRAWGYEFERRVDEKRRVQAEFGDRPRNIRMSLPVSLAGLAFEPSQAPEEPAEASARTGALLWLDDDTIALRLPMGVVAHFDRASVTALLIRDHNSPGAIGTSATWEVGYNSSAGERRLFFEGPGFALFPGQAESSADGFLGETGLGQIMGTGATWCGP